MGSKVADRTISTKLSLTLYLREALRRVEVDLADALRRKKFRTPMFAFVRYAKAHPKLKDLDRMEALQTVEAALNADGQDWGNLLESDDPRVEFIDAWDKIRIPAGAHALKLAVANAIHLPLKPVNPISDNYQRFISLAGHLQKLFPNSTIFLAEELLGLELGCTPRMVGNYRSLAVSQGYLKLIEPHRFSSHKATKFVFDVTRFDWATGNEKTGDEEDIPW